MDIFEKFAEMVVNFVRKYVVKFVVNKLLDWIWKKIKPKLLKIGRRLWQMLKDKLQKTRKKWLNIKEKCRKRACVPPQTLFFVNECQNDNQSHVVLIMIIVIDRQTLASGRSHIENIRIFIVSL